MPRNSHSWFKGGVLRRFCQHLCLCSNGPCQRLQFLGEASLRRRGCVEAASIVRRRCEQTFSGGACKQIEKSERDQEEPISSPTSSQSRRSEKERKPTATQIEKSEREELISPPTSSQSRREEERIPEAWLGVGPARHGRGSAADRACVFCDEAVLPSAAARHRGV